MNYIDIIHEDETSTVVMAPVDLPKSEILTISPLFTMTGRLFKNVSYIKDKHGNGYKVVGNYKDIIDIVHGGDNKRNIGYNAK